MELAVIWFAAIAVLWTGFFLLEGFDFGVGILMPFMGRRHSVDRRVAINAIGPVWDANEVWMITAVGAMFAAFPAWYASVFSGFYVPVFLVLIALIVRGVAFEYRHKRDSDRWRDWWDRAIFFGSAVPAFLWGLIFANIVRGVAMDADHIVTASPLDLLNPHALLGGVSTLALFTLHGAVFLTLKTDGPVRVRARRAALGAACVAVPAVTAFLLWTQSAHGGPWTLPLALTAVATLVGGVAAARFRREGWSFLATAATIVLTFATLLGSLFPNVLPSTTDPAFSLTVANASSADYTLTLMTWVAVVFLPLVLGYQGWSYWVFRQRVTGEQITRSTVTTGGKEQGRAA
ncbi:cytochrome c oxidase assembly protein [Nocardiopsis terrae]|uniref:Cytochrome d ubiquinol oxidase subunit II n=1 Tax=Nocardiopsis terrae TaxID=372655 RepID=A0ABR9HLN1_9ACTN|nr:cytochrome d ubiquinol oxidase subunit II [Nocardiopsis terrae]MBE1459881.1 cytochrome d ubiquinol oxidase subunit II [Nocardiopsis terrae]GHC93525.1 cytochrome c oxidase assembly protein [Nocardiopsis terrae]